jgi:hypothetical protein
MRKLPVSLQPKRLTDEERQRYAKRRTAEELLRITNAGGTLSDGATKWLNEAQAELRINGDISVTEGFEHGVTVRSVAVPSGAELDGLSREALLERIASSPVDGDELTDRAASAANYLGGHPETALILLDDAVGRANVTRLIWRALAYNFRPEKHLEDKDAVQTVSSRIQPKAEELLTRIAKLDNEELADLAEPLSYWLDAWRYHLAKSPQYLPAWYALWPHAVAHVNAEPVGDDALRDRAFSSAVGRLISALLHAMPKRSEARTAFQHPPFAEIMGALAQTGGEAGRHLRVSFVRYLRFLYDTAPAWTRSVLIDHLRRGKDIELWTGLTDVPQSPIVRVIGRSFVNVIVNGKLVDADRRRLTQIAILTHLYQHLPKPWTTALSPDLTRQMLRMGDDVVRAAAASAWKDFLANDKLPFKPAERFKLFKATFIALWPQDRTLNSPIATEQLVRLPAASRTHFAEVAAIILPFIVPFDCWSLHNYGVIVSGDGTRSIHFVESPADAESFLEVLHRTVGETDNARVPNSLERALDHIADRSPPLASDSRFKRLLTLSRR